MKLKRAFSRFWAGFWYRFNEVQWGRLSPQRLKPTLHTDAERNVWYLYVEIFWSAIFMAAMAFNATYALRLGASNTLIGWLSSLPALFAVVVMIPAARFLETKSDRAPWLKWGLFVGRLPFALVALVPWLFSQHQAEIIVGILILRSIPMSFFSAGFSPLLADILPARDRAQVMANRSIIHGATVAVCTFLFGRWLDAAANLPWATFPLNYQLAYLVGAVGAVLSSYYVSKLKVPETKVFQRELRPTVDKSSFAGFKQTLAALPRVARRVRSSVTRRENQGFVRLVINMLVFNFGTWLLLPLYVIFFVNGLQATDGWIGLNTTLTQIGVILGYVIWQRVIRKFGYDRALLLAVIPAAGYAFLVALFPNLTLILLWGILINLINPGVNLTHFNILIKLCPEDRRASYMATFSTAMNVGAFVGPLMGVALSNVMDIRWVLILGGVIRLGGAVMFHVWRVDGRLSRKSEVASRKLQVASRKSEVAGCKSEVASRKSEV